MHSNIKSIPREVQQPRACFTFNARVNCVCIGGGEGSLWLPAGLCSVCVEEGGDPRPVSIKASRSRKSTSNRKRSQPKTVASEEVLQDSDRS